MVLRCPVCLEALRRQPKCLPCGHVFCLTCLTAVFVKPVALPTGTAFGGLRCPLCRDLSFRAPRDLPTLFAVADLAETSPGGSLLLSRDTAGEEGEVLAEARLGLGQARRLLQAAKGWGALDEVLEFLKDRAQAAKEHPHALSRRSVPRSPPPDRARHRSIGGGARRDLSH